MPGKLKSNSNPSFRTVPCFEFAYLVQLDQVSAEALREALVDGWLATAPRPLADRYLAG